MKIIKGGVTAAQGFAANGLCCGIKRSGKLDLSLIYSQTKAVAAGVFTKNSVKAAPLLVSQKHLRNSSAQAIICNSGNANCFTGLSGIQVAVQTAKKTADVLSIAPEDVIVTSTGIIGKPLPVKKILKAAPVLAKGLTVKGSKRAAQGMLTTDTCVKECAVKIRIAGKPVTVGACAKGSGMIEPNMATMLCFVTTDALISSAILKSALKESSEKSFNRITVDGCMSTNDMVVVLANGAAGNKRITTKGKDYQAFVKALDHVCLDLAKKIVRDGEGATKFIEICVKRAPHQRAALKAAKAIANSVLVKTAAFGCNPNWGRVAAAVGSLELNIAEKDIKIKFSSFKKKNIQIMVDLNKGKATETVYTSDLSYDYIRINGEYN